MPYKDREDQKRWTKTRTGNYMKWLYAKRKLKFDKARVYQKLIEDIAAGLIPDPAKAADSTLDWAHFRERAVGNRFDHEKDVPYWKD